MNNTLTAVSLFTGAGGMDIGFERAGVKIIFANEMMSEAAQTYNAIYLLRQRFLISIICSLQIIR